MDPNTAKLCRFKWFSFVPRLISMWGIRKCHHFNPKLATFDIAISFTAYFVYVLYGPQNGKIKQIKVIKFVLRLILKRGIRRCQYFYPKLPMFAVAKIFTTYLIYVLYGPQNGKTMQIGVKTQNICYYYETFLLYIMSVTSVF